MWPTLASLVSFDYLVSCVGAAAWMVSSCAGATGAALVIRTDPVLVSTCELPLRVSLICAITHATGLQNDRLRVASTHLDCQSPPISVNLTSFVSAISCFHNSCSITERHTGCTGCSTEPLYTNPRDDKETSADPLG